MFGRKEREDESLAKAQCVAESPVPGYRGLSSRLDWLENDIHVLKSHVIGLYQHLGLERVKVIEETCADLRETIRQERLELRKIAPAKKG